MLLTCSESRRQRVTNIIFLRIEAAMMSNGIMDGWPNGIVWKYIVLGGGAWMTRGWRPIWGPVMTLCEKVNVYVLLARLSDVNHIKVTFLDQK